MYRVGRIKLYISIFILVMLESNLANLFSLHNTRPHLILIFVIFVALHSDWQEALECAVVGGLARGILSSDPVGLHIIILSLCGLLASYLKNKIFKSNFLTQFVLTFAMGILLNVIILFAGVIAENIELINVEVKYNFGPVVFWASLSSALAAPPLFFAFSKLLRTRNCEY